MDSSEVERVGAELLGQLNASAGILASGRELWRSQTASFHIFATNRTESCHTHPGDTTARTLRGVGAFHLDGRPPVLQRAGDTYFVPEGMRHAYGPSADYHLPVLVAVLWSPPFHDNYTVPAVGCVWS